MSAIYSFSMSNISRGGKASATASYAYISGEEVQDERTGLVKKYSREDEVLATGNILPKDAPQEYKDNAANWCNDLETMDKSPKARTAKRVRIAFPSELSLEQQIEAAEKWIDENCTKHGYPATYAIHSSKDGKNPHVHVIIANRALVKGKWQESKSKTEFRRDENGNKIPVIDPKTGKQKVIIEKSGKKKKQWQRYQTKENRSHMDKLSTLYDMRESWARVCNQYLSPDMQIDHRSYEAQGKLQIPTRHEGHAAREMEARAKAAGLDIKADVCEYNRQVRIRNAEIQKELAELDAQEATRRQGINSIISDVSSRITLTLKGKEAMELEDIMWGIKNMMYDYHAEALKTEAAQALGVDQEQKTVQQAIAENKNAMTRANEEHQRERVPLVSEEREAQKGVEQARRGLQAVEDKEAERSQSLWKILTTSTKADRLKAEKALRLAEKRHATAKTALDTLDRQHQARLQPLQAKAGQLEARANGIHQAIMGKVDAIGSQKVYGYKQIEAAISKFDNRHALPAPAAKVASTGRGAAGAIQSASASDEQQGMDKVMTKTVQDLGMSLIRLDPVGTAKAIGGLPLGIMANVESDEVKRDKMREAMEQAQAEQGLLLGGKSKSKFKDKDKEASQDKGGPARSRGR